MQTIEVHIMQGARQAQVFDKVTEDERNKKNDN
jgi:hypothetical protein